MKHKDSFHLECCNDDREEKYLTFWVDGQLLGIPVTDVIQIIGMQKIVEIPEHSSYVKGLICLRGEIVPVIDVRLRLGRINATYQERTCIIITKFEEGSFGFIVDGVDEVRDILEEYITPLSRIRSSWDSTYLTGVARLTTGQSNHEKIILIVDMARLAGEEGIRISTHAVKGELQNV
jgi:purine-binding chemotaxis protein CheW